MIAVFLLFALWWGQPLRISTYGVETWMVDRRGPDTTWLHFVAHEPYASAESVMVAAR